MFETSLIDLGTQAQPRRRWMSLPVAVAIHLFALASVTLTSYWNVAGVEPENIIKPLRQPLIPVSLIKRGQPEATTAPATSEKRTVEAKLRQTVQPDPESIPEKAPEGPPVPQSSGPTGPGHPERGDEGNPEGGTNPVENVILVIPEGPHVEPVLPEINTKETEAVRLTAAMTRPAVIHQVQPRYTKTALQIGLEGSVILEAVIDEQGRVGEIQVLRGLSAGLDREAVAAVEQWKFKPAMLGDRPVKVYYTLTVHFRIER
jgi:TonB family protein